MLGFANSCHSVIFSWGSIFSSRFHFFFLKLKRGDCCVLAGVSNLASLDACFWKRLSNVTFLWASNFPLTIACFELKWDDCRVRLRVSKLASLDAFLFGTQTLVKYHLLMSLFVLVIPCFWNNLIVGYEQELALAIWMLVFQNACYMSSSYKPLICPHGFVILNWKGLIVGYEQELLLLQI